MLGGLQVLLAAVVGFLRLPETVKLLILGSRFLARLLLCILSDVVGISLLGSTVVILTTRAALRSGMLTSCFSVGFRGCLSQLAAGTNSLSLGGGGR